MKKMISCRYALFAALTALFVGWTASADVVVVTNSTPFTISTPTTWSGITNIYTYTPGHSVINADLTLTDTSYLRVVGNKDDTTDEGLDLATTSAADLIIRVEKNSGFFLTYRNSTSPADWKATGIDPADGNAIKSNIKVRLGKEGGAKDSTGKAKIVVATTPSKFGSNATGAGFWAEWFFIESSAKAHDTGYIDFLQLNSGGIADITRIENHNTYHPARILFNGGRMRNNYMNGRGDQLMPNTNTVIVLEGINHQPVYIRKEYNGGRRLNGSMGTVRFQGDCEVHLEEWGANLPGVDNSNRSPLYIDPKMGPIEWKQTGDICIIGNGIVTIGTPGDKTVPDPNERAVLPYGADEPGLRLRGNAILDVNGRRLKLRSLISESSSASVTNVMANYEKRPVTSTLVFGTGDTDGIFAAKCCDNVNIEKVGQGLLVVSNATVKGSLTIAEGSVLFAGKNDFAKKVVIEEGVEVLADIIKSTDVIKSIDYTMPSHTGDPIIRYSKSDAGETIMYPGEKWDGLSVDVTGGVLRFSNVVKDKFWRFTIKTTYLNSNSSKTGVVDKAQVEINTLGLWATNVTKVTSSTNLKTSLGYGITTNIASATMTGPWQLPAGICMAEPQGMTWTNEQDGAGREYSGPEAVFNNQAHWCWAPEKTSDGKNAIPKLADTNTWISIDFRMRDTDLPIASFSPARTHWSNGVGAWILSSSPTGRDDTWSVRHEHQAEWVNTEGRTLAEADEISEYPHCDDNDPKTGAAQKISLKWYNNGVPYHFDQGGGAGETFRNIAAKVAAGATLDTGYIGDDYLSFKSLEVDLTAGAGTITKFAPGANGILYLKNLPTGRPFQKIRDIPIQLDRIVQPDNFASWAVYLDGVPQKGCAIVLVNGRLQLKHTFGFYLNFR